MPGHCPESDGHLYGRDVLPPAFRAPVLGDRHAAYAEARLAARLEPYQAYAPADRITKFSGEPSTSRKPAPNSPSATCCTNGGRTAAAR